MNHEKPKSGGRAKIIIFAVVIVALTAASALLPVKDYMEALLGEEGWLSSIGIWGPVILALVYVVATIFMVPGSLLTLGAGALFGPVVGFVCVSVGSVTGAFLSFLVGRTMARDFVEGKARQFPKFAAIDHAVEENGFKIVLLTRLSPIFPFNVLNYLFSITKVRTRDYFLASWIGMIPGTLLYVYLGSAAGELAKAATGTDAAGGGDLDWVKKGLFSVGLLATVVVTVYVTKIAKKAMAQYVPEEEA